MPDRRCRAQMTDDEARWIEVNQERCLGCQHRVIFHVPPNTGADDDCCVVEGCRCDADFPHR
jgi:hypothetical protein